MSSNWSRPQIALIACVGLLLSAAGSIAIAQETTTPAPDVAMGVEAPPEAGAVGSTYTEASFELWEQRCVKTEDGSDPCQLYQLLKDADGNSVAEFSLFGLPAGQQAVAGASIVAPLETLLTANLSIAVDANPAKFYPFTFCAQIGCVARVGFTAEEIALFKQGSVAVITIVPAAAPDKKVALEVSLGGFTAGYDAVIATTPAP